MLENTINNKSLAGKEGRKNHDTSLNPFSFLPVLHAETSLHLQRNKLSLGEKSHCTLADCSVARKLHFSSAFEDSIKFCLKNSRQVCYALILNNDDFKGLLWDKEPL